MAKLNVCCVASTNVFSYAHCTHTHTLLPPDIYVYFIFTHSPQLVMVRLAPGALPNELCVCATVSPLHGNRQIFPSVKFLWGFSLSLSRCASFLVFKFFLSRLVCDGTVPEESACVVCACARVCVFVCVCVCQVLSKDLQHTYLEPRGYITIYMFCPVFSVVVATFPTTQPSDPANLSSPCIILQWSCVLPGGIVDIFSPASCMDQWTLPC